MSVFLTSICHRTEAWNNAYEMTEWEVGASFLPSIPMLPVIEEGQKCLKIQHKGATSPLSTMLSLHAAHHLICSDSFLCPPICADLVFFFFFFHSGLGDPGQWQALMSSPTWWIWTWSSSACGMDSGFLALCCGCASEGRVGGGGWGVGECCWRAVKGSPELGECSETLISGEPFFSVSKL